MGLTGRGGSLILVLRLTQPEELANAALFLASDESSFMTGPTPSWRSTQFSAAFGPELNSLQRWIWRST